MSEPDHDLQDCLSSTVGLFYRCLAHALAHGELPQLSKDDSDWLLVAFTLLKRADRAGIEAWAKVRRHMLGLPWADEIEREMIDIARPDTVN